MRIKRRLLITLVIACTALLNAASAEAQKRSRRLVELRSLEPLKTEFQRDGGKVRLVTLLSPT